MANREEHLWRASKAGNSSEVNTILDDGKYKRPVNINFQHQGKTPLFVASEHGHARVMDILLDHQADVNIPDGEGSLPLHEAARGNSLECLDILIRRGAHVNVLDSAGTTPLMTAAWKGRDENIERLLQAGARTSLRNDDGFTAHDFAVRFGNRSAAAKIQACSDKRKEKIELRLMKAVKAGNLEQVREILHQQVNIDYVGEKGNTALHFAVKDGNREIVRLLLENEARADIRNSDDDTAYDLTLLNHDKETRKIFLEFGKKVALHD